MSNKKINKNTKKLPKNFVESDYYYVNKKYIDNVGVKFNHLTILSFPGYQLRKDNRKLPVCKVLCDCGNQYLTVATYILNGRSKSCGCANSRYKEGDESSCRDLMNRYKYTALKKKKDCPFNLTFKEFYKLIKQDCYYCGIEPSQIRNCENCKENCVYNGVDRVDSSKGYFIDNCVPCCKICNQSKMDMPLEDYEEYLLRLTKFQLKKILLVFRRTL